MTEPSDKREVNFSEDTPITRDLSYEETVSYETMHQGIMIRPLFAQTTCQKAIAVPRLAFVWHPYSTCCALISVLICWSTGHAQHSVIDPMMFKSIFLVFGFALSFRNVRANFRYGEGLRNIRDLFAAAWSVIVLFPEPEQRKLVGAAMIRLLEAISDHFVSVANRGNHWYALVGLRPAKPHVDSLACFAVDEKPLAHAKSMAKTDGMCIFRSQDDSEESPVEDIEMMFAPRHLMVTTFVMIGNAICRIEAMPLQDRKRTFWLLRDRFFVAYDNCEVLTLPSVTQVFSMLIDICLFAFGVLLPWGVAGHSERHGIRFPKDASNLDKPLGAESIKALMFILLSTLGCALVLYGLNALAHENEQPFQGLHHETVKIHDLVARFRVALAAYERKRGTTSTDSAEDQWALLFKAEGPDADACRQENADTRKHIDLVQTEQERRAWRKEDFLEDHAWRG